MASNKAPAKPPAKTGNVLPDLTQLPFTVLPEDFTAPPPPTRGGGAKESPFSTQLSLAPIGRYWFAPAAQPEANIQDPVEREKQYNDNANKIVGAVKSAIRTFKKKEGNAEAEFEAYKHKDGEGRLGALVRRIK